ncbi:stimulus-sensing domain-containing protein [Acuticoccus mangrovi]|uniref:histidine kinase n=1 Tax=Acuticoccus mangrovi TaxID=2796142 RepID=A0A934MMY8_9HYPH|nr:stimulus-sensing domain-containing protein [Acuticoccus mangrovi]MBJ3777704.1 sensor N-terminal transmembrane domain-containing protein [Acuticoccus mangrovi]
MNVRERFGAASRDAFGPNRRRFPNLAAYGVSRLAAKIIVVALVGLTVLLFATLHQAQLRAVMTDAVLESLLVQADAIANAIGGVGDASRPPLVTLNAVEDAASEAPTERTRIDRDRVERVFAELLEGTATRARLYGISGDELADSRFALRSGLDVTHAPLPPLGETQPSTLGGLWNYLAGLVTTPPITLDPNGATLPGNPREIRVALTGVKTAEQRLAPDGDIIISVAAPVLDASGAVAGALLVTSGSGAVTEPAHAQETAILKGFLAAGALAIVVSLLLAASISRPISRLARAAERIERGGAYTPMPELRDSSEIGDLSRVLHDMTVALYMRIDAIEAFAGEVAHELKNPLTSLRSAVETLPLARTDRARDKLLSVIQHDVRRIDRLISDISDASKLDAELNRYRYEPFDLVHLLRAVVATQSELAAERNQQVDLAVRSPGGDFTVFGNDGRLGQVFTNLIDNARSFTPMGGRVVVSAQRFASFVEVVVDDEGPGIEEAVMERIFERFYTDRTEQQSFGDNSGLGLAISRQIVEAHGGEIFAENRYRTTLTPDRDVAGARFTVRLPAAS